MEINMAVTIPIPSDDSAQQIAMNRRAKQHSSTVVPTSQKMAAVLLRLNPAVTPGDYGSLGTQIKAIPGIDNINLLIDGQTPASIPAGTEMRLHIDAHLRINPTGE